MDSRLLQVWLSEKNAVTPIRAMLLEDYFGSIENIYRADIHDYQQIEDLPKYAAVALCDKSLDAAKRIISDCEKLDIKILASGDEGFPKALTGISQPVRLLYYKGHLPDWDSILGIAIVGTRKSSEYGHMVSERIGRELAQAGITVISGMARGIDSYALKAALGTGAEVIAVMGCGLDSAYPPENSELMERIINQGCAISEYPPYSPPDRPHFPERNRIISGLSKGVLAVEAPKKSGTLITAKLAMESGRQVFSVPGSIFNKNSAGTNYLIKIGAQAVTCAKDILDAYPISAKNLKKPELDVKESPPIEIDSSDPRLKELGEEERLIAELLLSSDMHIEELAAKSKMTIAKLNAILPILEIEGIAAKQAGSIYKFIPKDGV